MKKFSFIIALLAALVGFTSCSEDRDPVYKAPTTFVLNVPEMQNQYIELTEGNVLELTCSQPDYGYSAICVYSAEVSLTEDFAEYKELAAAEESQCHIQLKQEDIATAICQLHGVTDEESYVDRPAETVYFRAVCKIKQVENSTIKSNVVAYNRVKAYFAIPQPGFIFLVGQPEGWAGPTAGNAAHYEPWKLKENADEIGSKVYHGTFTIDAGSAMFRFYTALTGWDADSYGSQADDSPLDFDFTDGQFSSRMVKGKGSFNFPNWTGGDMEITVDMSDMDNIQLTIKAL
ncbi:MAG: SusE domain-containing protein [Muribaculaceae bacterium]